jgi:hypothetical protein
MIRPGLILFAFVAGAIAGAGFYGCAHAALNAEPSAEPIAALSAELNAGLVVDVPSQTQILACRADAYRLCGRYLGGPIDVIRACMMAHKSQLSKTCRAAFR